MDRELQHKGSKRNIISVNGCRREMVKNVRDLIKHAKDVQITTPRVISLKHTDTDLHTDINILI